MNAPVTTMRDRLPGVKMLTGFPHTSFVVPVRAFAAPVDVPVGKRKEFDLPFYQATTIQRVASRVLDPSQPVDCTENGR